MKNTMRQQAAGSSRQQQAAGSNPTNASSPKGNLRKNTATYGSRQQAAENLSYAQSNGNTIPHQGNPTKATPPRQPHQGNPTKGQPQEIHSNMQQQAAGSRELVPCTI